MRSLKKEDTAVFFFAGHGCEYKNSNYLITQQGCARDDELPDEAFKVQDLLDDMEDKARLSLIILDCCRTFEGMHRSTRAGSREPEGIKVVPSRPSRRELFSQASICPSVLISHTLRWTRGHEELRA